MVSLNNIALINYLKAPDKNLAVKEKINLNKLFCCVTFVLKLTKDVYSCHYFSVFYKAHLYSTIAIKLCKCLF